METRPRARWVALITTIAALGVLIPTVASGTDGNPPNGPVTGEESILFLTRSSNDFFQWENSLENIKTRKNDCTAITFTDDDLVTVTATGNPTVPDDEGVLGDVKDGFGELAASDGSGEPCGRIDAPDQGVSVKLTGLLSDYAMSRVDLDLELKFEATATLYFYANGTQLFPNAAVFKKDDPPLTAPVANGVVSFSGDATTGDDGPDSKDGDNYRAYVEPKLCDADSNGNPILDDDGNPVSCEPVYFDEIVVSASAGAVSLEGGADFESNSPDPGSFGAISGPPADGDYDARDHDDRNTISSQFGVVRIYDGTLDCGDTVTIGDGIDEPQGTFERLEYAVDGNGDPILDENNQFVCVLKFYDIASSFADGVNQVDFNPTATATARYSASLVSVPYTAGNPVLQTLSYDPQLDGTYQDMKWCTITPADWSSTDVSSSNVLPTDESWCITGTSTQPAVDSQGAPILDENGNQKVQTIWTVIGEDDPGFRFS